MNGRRAVTHALASLEMPTFPGPPALGRGAVVRPGVEVPTACASWPRFVVDDDTLASPAVRLRTSCTTSGSPRRPFVVVLAAGCRRAAGAPERTELAPFELDPAFEFARERLQFLVWSNTYDLRGPEPIWWHGRRAERLGARPGDATDVVLGPGVLAWCDGGPRQPLDLGDGSLIVHREEIEAAGSAPTE